MNQPRFLALIILTATLTPVHAADEAVIDYGRDIRPILSNACFKCHGPAVQKAKLRLDERESALNMLAIAPGQPAQSDLLKRILLDEGDEHRMPPRGAGARLTPTQVALLTAWIKQGAKYSAHWALVKPVRPPVPRIPDHKSDSVQPIDAFVLAKLATANVKPSPMADRTTLIRRVSLDLTGLVPTVQELDAFLKDDSPGAYVRVVDRLLASPHYGERHARHWLDLARYADSNGFTIDSPRQIWPYRDWVINALNNDMPFDRFTREQLAGDLLPNATRDQKVATGFHRNTTFNEEGGSDPEQFRVERTVDRTNTTAAVWLGLTAGCAQCHDHKYDPFSQSDYYRMYAFFNSCDEPTLPLGGDPGLEQKIAELQKQVAAARLIGDDAETKRLNEEIKKSQGKVPTTLVMKERTAPRQTHIQIRGDFLRQGAAVTPGYPAALGTTPVSTTPLTRLDLANWLVSAENPLTARVIANREWQKFFGHGLVETENDFGFQGSFPTHPELLDWLARELVESGWSLKKFHRMIVMSDTYRQSSVMRAELREKDPRNLLLARQNRLRLEAEIIRDVALCASGKLEPKIGGPGVFPPQPKELFAFTQNQRAWKPSTGGDRYRRGMYTYIWRQSQHHLLTTFDAADAQTACTKRNRSNTPLQALHLANDPVFVELAEFLGKRVEAEALPDDADRIRFAFRLCFSREPTLAEAARVTSLLRSQRQLDAKTAWPALARVLMNLDEFITRE